MSPVDGGGVRGYWSLLVLKRLMEHIGEIEEQGKIYHSFFPEAWPENVTQVPLTEEEATACKNAYSQEDRLRAISRSQRYLPCHYFDEICGSGISS